MKKEIHSTKSLEDKSAQITRVEFDMSERRILAAENLQPWQATKGYCLKITGAQIAGKEPKWPCPVEGLKECSRLRNLVQLTRIVLVSPDTENESVEATAEGSALRQVLKSPKVGETRKVACFDFDPVKLVQDWMHCLSKS